MPEIYWPLMDEFYVIWKLFLFFYSKYLVEKNYMVILFKSVFYWKIAVCKDTVSRAQTVTSSLDFRHFNIYKYVLKYFSYGCYRSTH